ncbi:MAG: lipid-A-disaccharide synthase [bacterium]
MRTQPTILITCGEVSGDMHAANLVTEIRRRFPGARVLALGGERLAGAGAEVLYRIEDYAIIGFSGVLTKLPKLLRLERNLKRVLDRGVDLFIPVDYPGLNLRLAAHAKKSGIPVLYYISPQVWAWGGGRVEKLSQVVDRMAVILPFEEAFFKEHGIPAEFVGHPLVEDGDLPPPVDQDARDGVGLLPGSRTSEVRRILPIFLSAARAIREHEPDVRFTIGRSPVDIDGVTKDVMATSQLLLVASGTATLQGALFETPLIISYRLSAFNYLIARRLVRVSNIGLVNIILGEEVCPEFVQADARPKLIAEKAIILLGSLEDRRVMVEKFRGLREMLSGNGGCRRVAEMSAQLLDHS